MLTENSSGTAAGIGWPGQGSKSMDCQTGCEKFENATNIKVMYTLPRNLPVFTLFILMLLMSVIGFSGENHTALPHILSSPKPSEHFRQNTRAGERIKIGLLLTTSPENDFLAQSAARGAQLAVDQANKSGGYDGRPFGLVIRTTDGLWGAGSKESVSLVHDDQVVAIVTAVDGRNAHLAEQVVAKSHLVQIATRATEETLSQAFVPWFFRLVPDDGQQAQALTGEIFLNQGHTNVHVLQEDNYDSEKAADAFLNAAEKQGYAIMGRSVYLPGKSDEFNPVMEESTEALVVFGTFQRAEPILTRLKNERPSLQIYGALSMTADGQIGAGYSTGCEGGIFVSSKFCFTTSGQTFKDKYMEAYGGIPNPAASYAYDGISLVIEAVRKAGPDREKIRDYLKDIDYRSGVTGSVRFDEYGNRTSPVFLIRMIKGHPVILNP